MSHRYKLGVVSYLNALPLYRTLETNGQVEVLRAVPSKLAGMLSSGQCDAAIMPVVDYFRGVGSALISDACIGTKREGDGAVRSVLLFHRGPIEEIKSVALDTSSHTSVALIKILLADGYGLHPHFRDHAPNLREMLRDHDSALIIGDAALEALQGLDESIQILDLGSAWKKFTGKPFVFAAWIARPGLDQNAREELGAILSHARDEGMANLTQIVAQNPIPTSLTSAQVEDYLREAIEPTLSQAHRDGINEFQVRCKAHGLC